MRPLTTIAALWLLAAPSGAQELASGPPTEERAATLCHAPGPLRDVLVDALRVELRARRVELSISCEPHESESEPAWQFEVEAPSPLGDVWIRCAAPDGAERRVRIDGALDVLDPRVFALTVGSMLDAAPAVPITRAPPADERESVLGAEPLADPATSRAAATEPPAGDGPGVSSDSSAELALSEGTSRDGELVRSTRHLGNVVAFGVGAAGSLLPRQNGALGGTLFFALYLSPWFRFEVNLRGAGWSDVGEGILQLGFAGLIDLDPTSNWIEIGLGPALALESAQDLELAVGTDVYVGFLQRLTDSLRFAVRAHVTPMYLMGSGRGEVPVALEAVLVISP